MAAGPVESSGAELTSTPLAIAIAAGLGSTPGVGNPTQRPGVVRRQ